MEVFLSCATSLFVEEGAEEIRRLTNKVTIVTERTKRKRQRQQTIKSFFFFFSKKHLMQRASKEQKPNKFFKRVKCNPFCLTRNLKNVYSVKSRFIFSFVGYITCTALCTRAKRSMNMDSNSGTVIP